MCNNEIHSTGYTIVTCCVCHHRDLCDIQTDVRCFFPIPTICLVHYFMRPLSLTLINCNQSPHGQVIVSMNINQGMKSLILFPIFSGGHAEFTFILVSRKAPGCCLSRHFVVLQIICTHISMTNSRICYFVLIIVIVGLHIILLLHKWFTSRCLLNTGGLFVTGLCINNEP